MPRVIVSTALSVALVQLLTACTLTTEPFEPESWVGGLGNDAGESPSLAGPSASERADAGISVEASCEGGSELPGCDLPLAPRGDCESDLDCESQVCTGGRCVSATCSDGRQNGSEAGVDCGPGCEARCGSVTSCEDADGCGVVCREGCAPGAPCAQNGDCASLVCGDEGRCEAPSCDDGVHNQNETAADCGGSCPNDCAVRQACAGGDDCQTGACAPSECPEGVERCCQPPSCSDGVRNGAEPVIDCGDVVCGPCPLDRACTSDGQCASGVCEAGFCRAPSCTDAAQNGAETGVDCGGACRPCAPGLGCDIDADCESGACQDGRCCGGREQDCTRCARRLAGVLTCELSTDPVARDNCNAFLSCLASNVAVCPVRHAAGCSEDPGGVCNNTSFGGNGGPGLVLADSILGTASCSF